MPRLTPGASRAFSLGHAPPQAVSVLHGAPRTLRAVFNFIPLINRASFEHLSAISGQFLKDSGLTLLQLRRQDATDFASANWFRASLRGMGAS
jgi:hypothetical protein